MDKIDQLKESASDRVLLLDGAMGTLIQTKMLTERDFCGDRFIGRDRRLLGNFDILSLTQPSLVSAIHKSYLEAGSDIIKTNTFNGSALEQRHYHTDKYVYEINFKSAQLAQKEADNYSKLTPAKPRFVAGVIGPTRYVGSSKGIKGILGFEVKTINEILESYKPQVQGLIDGGVDILLLETIYDQENTRTALSIVNDIGNGEFPVWLSATILPGFNEKEIENLFDNLIHLSNDFNVICLGLNCSTGDEKSIIYLKYLIHRTNLLVSFYPSAGLPDKNGKYPAIPKSIFKITKYLVNKNLINIIGGCCGTTPGYIKQLSEII